MFQLLDFGRSLIEYDHGNGNFRHLKASKLNTSKNQVVAELSKVIPGYTASTTKVLSRSFEDYYFLLPIRFSHDLFKWINNKSAERPVIDNSEIYLMHTSKDKYFHVSNRTCTCVNEKAWKILLQVFGGGPEIKVKYRSSMRNQYHLIFIKVALHSQTTHFKGFTFNTRALVSDIFEAVKRYFKIKTDFNLYEFHDGRVVRRLSIISKMEIRKLNLEAGSLLVLEVKNAQHLFEVLYLSFSSETKLCPFRTQCCQVVYIDIVLTVKQLNILRRILVSMRTTHLALYKQKIPSVVHLVSDSLSLKSFHFHGWSVEKYDDNVEGLIYMLKMFSKQKKFNQIDINCRFQDLSIARRYFLGFIDKMKSNDRTISFTGTYKGIAYLATTMKGKFVIHKLYQSANIWIGLSHAHSN